MKKVLLTAVAVFSLTFVNAQEEVKETKGFGFSQGNIMLEGNLGFSSNTETDSDNTGDIEETKTSSFNFNPKAGYFVSDKFAVGVEFMIGSGKSENTVFGTPNVTTENTSNGVGAGVFARYYFLELGERFKTYAEAGLGFGSSTWETNGTETQKDSNFGLGFDLGMNYFITEKMAINFGLANVLGFNSTTSEFPGGGETTNSGINGNINVFDNFFDTPTFGLTYKF